MLRVRHFIASVSHVKHVKQIWCVSSQPHTHHRTANGNRASRAQNWYGGQWSAWAALGGPLSCAGGKTQKIEGAACVLLTDSRIVATLGDETWKVERCVSWRRRVLINDVGKVLLCVRSSQRDVFASSCVKFCSSPSTMTGARMESHVNAWHVLLLPLLETKK